MNIKYQHYFSMQHYLLKQKILCLQFLKLMCLMSKPNLRIPSKQSCVSAKSQSCVNAINESCKNIYIYLSICHYYSIAADINSLSISCFIKPFFPNAIFLYPLKIYVFRGKEKGCMGNECVKKTNGVLFHRCVSPVSVIHHELYIWLLFSQGN